MSARRLKALLAVDVFGQPAELDALEKTAKKYELKLIEDSCEALGAEYKGKKAGTFGFGGVFAFYPNKQITTGEGGVIVTNDDEAAALMRALRNQGRAPGDTWLSHTYLGYNYRLDEMSAALGAAQMQRFEELSRKRQQVADWYAERLAEIPGVEIPDSHPRHHAHELVRVCDPAAQRDGPEQLSPPGWRSAASRCGRTSCPSTCSPTWWSASVTARAISRSPRTWASAGWQCPSRG